MFIIKFVVGSTHDILHFNGIYFYIIYIFMYFCDFLTFVVFGFKDFVIVSCLYDQKTF